MDKNTRLLWILIFIWQNTKAAIERNSYIEFKVEVNDESVEDEALYAVTSADHKLSRASLDLFSTGCQDISSRRFMTTSFTSCDPPDHMAGPAQVSSYPHVTLSPASCRDVTMESYFSTNSSACTVTSQWQLECRLLPPSAAVVITEAVLMQDYKSLVLFIDDNVGTWPHTEVLLGALGRHGVRVYLYGTRTARDARAALSLHAGTEHVLPFVLLCSQTMTQVLLQQAYELKLRTLEYYWIIFTDTPTFDLELSVTDNIIFVANDYEITEPMTEEYFDAILTSVRNMTSSFNETVLGEENPADAQCSLNMDDGHKSNLLLHIKEALESSGVNASEQASYTVSTSVHLPSGSPGLQQVAAWSQREGLQKQDEFFPNSFYGFNNRKFTVTSLEYSFFQKKKYDSNGEFVGWEGLSFQLLDELSAQLNFTYEVVEPPDMQWGIMEEDGNWTGMIGMVMDKQVDFAAAGFSITAAREEVVDFAAPYFHEQTVVVIKRPTQASRLVLFLQPFTWRVWSAVVLTILTCTTLIWMFTRLSPYYEIHGTRQRGCPSNYFSLTNTFLLTLGSLTQQGSVWLPQAQSGRIMLSFFWFWCVVLIATYTGNLIAFLAVSTVEMPFNTLSEMTRAGTHRWGSATGVALVMLFRVRLQDSRVEPYVSVHKGMDYSESYSEGLERVKQGGYAFITEKSWYQAVAAEEQDEDCDLAVIGEEFYPTSYGYAFQTESPYTRHFSYKIDKMRESGLLHKWIKDWTPKNLHCKGLSPVTEATQVTVTDFQGGVFFAVLGLGLALLMLGAEFAFGLWICPKPKDHTGILQYKPD